MSYIFKFFIDNWKFSLVMTLFVVMMGLLGLGILQREAFPPVNFARVTVNTIYPGASPEEVQDKVTKIIEDELRGIDGVKDVRSVSQNEKSEIDIRIDIDNADSEQVVNEIQRAVQRAQAKLPADLPEAPLVREDKAKEIPLLEVALVGDNKDRQRDRFADRLKEVIEDIKGVSAVQLSGYHERELQVLLDRQKLAANAVGLTEVISALKNRIKNVPAGYVGDRVEINLLRVLGKVTDPTEVENLIVRSNDVGRIVRIKDLGRVVEGSEKPRIKARLDGQEATLLLATKRQDADALKVLDLVRVELEKFQQKLPSDYKLIVYNDEGRRIANRLEIVSFNAIAGLLIVLIVLFLFLPGRVGLFSAMSLPICALGTIAIMVYMGANFNIITMVALIICLGNLVDNSVVISEHYTSLREKMVPAREAALKAAQQFWIPFTASTITIIAAFLPMIVTKGVMGQFIRWIPIVVTIALVLSLLEALTLLPARLQFLHPKNNPEQKSKNWFTHVEESFARLIRWSLKKRYTTLGILTAVIFSGFFVTAVFNRFELFPAEGIEYYVIRYEAPPETSIHKTDEIGKNLSEKVQQVLGSEIVDSIVSRAGIQQVNQGDIQGKTGENVGFLLVAIKPEVAPDLDINETLKKLRAIPKPPELIKLTSETIENGPPVGKPLTVTFRSSNYQQLQAAARSFKEKVATIPGVQNIEDDESSMGEEYRLKLKDSEMAYASVTLDSVGLNVRTALEGTTVADLTQFGKEYEVKVRFDDEDKSRIDDILNSSVLNSRGNLVPLRSIGWIEKGEAPKAQRNFDFLRSITVTAEVDPLVITSSVLNSKAREIFSAEAEKFTDVTIKFGGEEESTNESLQSLAIALLLAVFGIFATLVFTFRSFSKPILILSTIPLGLIGVFYAFAVDQRPLSFLAFIGVVGLTGVVINSAIILVDYIDELKAQMPDRSTTDILVQASAQRLRAVLATGLTTVVGLLPTAFGWGGYDALLVPITLALSWGMIVGTVLSLIWIPSAYLILTDLRSKVLQKLGFSR